MYLKKHARTLFATLMKNCEPPEFGRPVLAIERVPGVLEVRSMFSSLMLPPASREYFAPEVGCAYVVLPGGPPVPGCPEAPGREFGQPNWFMNPSITRWKVRPE
jgi:hypothetical protein